MAKKEISATVDVSVRERFIERLRQVVPKGIGLADELSSLLDISSDSAYRRIRGETSFTIEEMYIICRKYNISIDDIFSNRADTVTFAYTKLIESADSFHLYFTRLLGHLSAISKAENRQIYYVAEETPLFYSFFTPKFTAFKLFYWQRSVVNVAEYQDKKFDWDVIPAELVKTAHESFKVYMSIPSLEVWTSETVLTGLKQVKYYYDSGIVTEEHALELLADYRNMIGMVQQNAATGKKTASDKDDTFQLYHSEVVLGTNCIYVVMGSNRYSYISFNTLNSLTTSNPGFCEETEHWIKSVERKSVLISGAGEKLRNRFFNSMFKKIDQYMDDIRNDRHG